MHLLSRFLFSADGSFCLWVFTSLHPVLEMQALILCCVTRAQDFFITTIMPLISLQIDEKVMGLSLHVGYVLAWSVASGSGIRFDSRCGRKRLWKVVLKVEICSISDEGGVYSQSGFLSGSRGSFLCSRLIFILLLLESYFYRILPHSCHMFTCLQ